MNYAEEILRVNEVYLDQENPRFPPTNNQRESIEAMLRDQEERIVTLALDIYQNGLNPSSKLILFKQGPLYVDGDGNRRLTALKILETPSLAESAPKIRKKIESILKGSGAVPDKLACVVFNTRGEARHWISINHGGAQEGRGQINWSPEQKDRFESKPSIGLEALDLLAHRGLITDVDKSRVNKSTLDRLLSYKDVKDNLIIHKQGNHFTFGNVENLKLAVLGLRDKAVDEVYTADKGKKFLDTVIDSSSLGLGSEDKCSAATLGGDIRAPSIQGSRSRRIKKQGIPIFGGVLTLKSGHVNNLYRDVDQLHDFYLSEKTRLSVDFIVIIRMSLRLLAETASKDQKKELNDYIKDNFDQAKTKLDQNAKTTLSNQNVSKESVVKLFHTGAHDYMSSKNEEQALALSIILGAILNITHGRRL